MKIVIDARESGTSTGRYIDKLVENLDKLKPDHDLTILTKTHRVEYLKSVAPGFKVVESNFKEFSFAEQFGLWRQLKGLRADLVHFGMTQQPVLYSGKSVTTVHDLITLRFYNPSKNWLVFKTKQIIYGWVIKRVARKSNHLLTGSKYVKDDLVRYSRVDPAKITVTYEAADKISARPEEVVSLVDKKFIMYVGRPTPHKNLARLVEAFEELAKKHPELRLALAGKTDKNYIRIQEMAARRGLSQKIIFTGFINEAQLRWMYENCQAYVFPSLSEGFGLPGLEAMAHSAPVVSSDATCLPEIYGQAAHYFNPLDAADIAAKISEVLNDPKLRQRLIVNGRSQVKKYSWRKMAEQTLAIYDSF